MTQPDPDSIPGRQLPTEPVEYRLVIYPAGKGTQPYWRSCESWEDAWVRGCRIRHAQWVVQKLVEGDVVLETPILVSKRMPDGYSPEPYWMPATIPRGQPRQGDGMR
jgi:hypothetical protein